MDSTDQPPATGVSGALALASALELGVGSGTAGALVRPRPFPLARVVRVVVALAWLIGAWLVSGPVAAQPAPAPAGAGTEAATTTAAAPASPPTTAPASIRLRNLEQRVDSLKEQAWRAKARVGLLKEAVLGTGLGARASIVHENKMGGNFRLVKLVYVLDGQQIFSRLDESGKLHDMKRLDILSGPMAPGSHTLSVLMIYRGNGFGVFAYLKGYTFTVRSSHTFAVSDGKLTQLTVVGYEKGGVTTPLEKRPAVDFKVNVASDKGNAATTSPGK